MPENAIDHVRPDLVLPLADIGPAIVERASQPPAREVVTIAPNWNAGSQERWGLREDESHDATKEQG
jgi:hypothetical protein